MFKTLNHNNIFYTTLFYDASLDRFPIKYVYYAQKGNNIVIINNVMFILLCIYSLTTFHAFSLSASCRFQA